ncbi:hypothetical protein EJ03DRAFT_273328 [Teratosphaeria nubilosa]|uniref:Myb-like domain-containing protein n=1 Tax=Teratosphaeria nubilosa TaxID=161662 RepID=A0A6G1L7Y7_9PEZI|nr:hypothetical protein EJ03DRAFT_273328 [Teratosphaeria nubilosa]
MASSSRKRSHPSEEYTYELPGSAQLQVQAAASGGKTSADLTQHGHHARPRSGASSYYVPSQHTSPHPGNAQAVTQSYQTSAPTHHHHRLPHQPPPMKSQRMGYEDSPGSTDEHGPPSVVGHPGMPAPASRPKGPKLKFTSEDDALLVELKESKNLTWKQIADFFPGRSSGTLQVRYCTKLKAKTTVWTDEMVRLQRLRSAMEEYEIDRWRIISSKVGNGFSAAACKERALELQTEPVLETAEQDETSHRSQHEATTAGPAHNPYAQVEAYDFPRIAETS